MESSHRGFVVTALLAVAALLIVAGGAYVYLMSTPHPETAVPVAHHAIATSTPALAQASSTEAVDCNLNFEVEPLQNPIANTAGEYQTRLFINEYSFSRPIWIVVRKDLSGSMSVQVPPVNGPVVLAKLFGAGNGAGTSIVYAPQIPVGQYFIQLYADDGDKKFDASDHRCLRPSLKLTDTETIQYADDAWKIGVLDKPTVVSF